MWISKSFIAWEFEIKDLGVLTHFLGIKFEKSKKEIFVTQRKYVLNLLSETGLDGCKLVETPMESNAKLEASGVERVGNREQYQRLVGKLIYLLHTWPNIAFLDSIVSQFMHSPGDKHLKQSNGSQISKRDTGEWITV